VAHKYILTALGSRVERIVSGLTKEEVTGRWRKVYSEELHNFTLHEYYEIKGNVTNVTRSAPGTGEKCVRKCGRKSLRERDNLRDIGVDGNIY
jgi:hypothetical protein